MSPSSIEIRQNQIGLIFLDVRLNAKSNHRPKVPHRDWSRSEIASSDLEILNLFKIGPDQSCSHFKNSTDTKTFVWLSQLYSTN